MQHPLKVLAVTSAGAALAAIGLLVATASSAPAASSGDAQFVMLAKPRALEAYVGPCLCPICTRRVDDDRQATVVTHTGWSPSAVV